MPDKSMTEEKRELLKEIIAMIQEADLKQLYFMYGTATGFGLSKEAG